MSEKSKPFSPQFYRLSASAWFAWRRALAKVLSLHDIPDKYIKVIGAMYENNIAAVKVENEVSRWFRIKSGVKQGCVLFPFIWILFMDFVLGNTAKAMGEHGINCGSKYLLDLDCADDLMSF